MFIFLDNQTGFLLIVKYVKNSKIIFCYCKIVATPQNKYEYTANICYLHHLRPITRHGYTPYQRCTRVLPERYLGMFL